MLRAIPKFLHPEIRHLIGCAFEDAWQEVRNDSLADTVAVRRRLATTIVALPSPAAAQALEEDKVHRAFRESLNHVDPNFRRQATRR